MEEQDTPVRRLNERLQAQRKIKKFINDFELRHSNHHEWIPFSWIDESGARNGGPRYRELVQAMLSGRFDRDGESQVWFLSAGWLNGVDLKPEDLTISKKEFRDVLRAHQRAQKNDALLVDEYLIRGYLSRFWIPRRTCWEWFVARQYKIPPWLEIQSGASAAVKAPRPDRPRKADREKMAAQQYAEWREMLDRYEHLPTIKEDKKWASERSYSQGLVLGRLRPEYDNLQHGKKNKTTAAEIMKIEQRKK